MIEQSSPLCTNQPTAPPTVLLFTPNTTLPSQPQQTAKTPFSLPHYCLQPLSHYCLQPCVRQDGSANLRNSSFYLQETRDAIEGQRTIIIYSDGPRSSKMSVSIRPSLSAIHCAGCWQCRQVHFLLATNASHHICSVRQSICGSIMSSKLPVALAIAGFSANVVVRQT